MGVKKILSHLKQLDFLGTGVNLNISGQDRLKSYLGALLSVCLLASLLTVWWFQAQTYLDTSSPQIFQEFSDLDDGAEVDLLQKKLLPTFGIYDEVVQNGVPAADVAKYVTVKAYAVENTYNQATSSWNMVTAPLNPVACSTLTPEERTLYDFEHFGSESRFTGYLNDKAICLKPPTSSLKISGSVAKSRVLFFAVHLLPCSLTSGCVSAVDFAKVSVVLGDSKKSIKYADLASPVSTIPNMNSLYHINQAMTQEYQMNYRLNEIYDNFGFGYSAKLRSSYFDIGSTGYLTRMRNSAVITCTEAQITASACAPYLKFSYRSSPRYSKTIRNYKGPMETLGEMGGLKEIFFIAFFLLYFPFDYFNKQRYILEKVFGIKRDIKEFFSFQRNMPSGDELGDEAGKGFCCFKKQRTGSEQECQQELQALGSDLIEKNLDVVTLVRALNDLRMLMGTFINEKQERIASFVSLRKQASLRKEHRRVQVSSIQVLPQQEGNQQLEPILPVLLEYSKLDTMFLDEISMRTKYQFVDYYIQEVLCNKLSGNQNQNQNQAISLNELPPNPHRSLDQGQESQNRQLEIMEQNELSRFGPQKPKEDNFQAAGGGQELKAKKDTVFPLSSRPVGKGYVLKANKSLRRNNLNS